MPTVWPPLLLLTTVTLPASPRTPGEAGSGWDPEPGVGPKAEVVHFEEIQCVSLFFLLGFLFCALRIVCLAQGHKDLLLCFCLDILRV